MGISKDTIIGDLVATDYRTASVFKESGIDFCCNGNRTIANACAEHDLDTDKILSQLENLSQEGSKAANDYNSWPLDLLADYVEKRHHRFVQEKTQEIIPYLEKIVRVHGPNHPELAEVEKLFKESAGDMAVHMKKEELTLFPFIRKLVKAHDTKTPLDRTPSFGSVENPIDAMMHDHDRQGEIYREIAALTNNYTTPEDGCNTYRVTLNLINEFEEDLHLHIHLENNILFPKAIELEKQLN